MRKPYGWTVLLALIAVAFSYACSDDATTDPGAEDDVDSGLDASKGHDAESPPKDAGDAARPLPDASDAGDAGDAEIDAGPPKIMVVRAGQLDGGTIGRNAAAVFVDEYELGMNTVVRTIALPSEPSGVQQRLVQSSAAIQIDEGEIARSADGHSVAVTGYTNYHPDPNGPPPFVVFGPDISSAPRVVARIQADGKVDTTTLISDSFAPTNIGGAVMSGTDVWIGGTSGGPVGPVQYLHFANSLDGGATGGGDLIPPGPTHHAVRIFDGQLYASTDDSITRVGTGLPKTGGQTEVALVQNLFGAFEFEFVDMDGVAGAERLYVAVEGDGTDGGVEGGVRKYTYDAVAKTWSLAATFKNGVAKGAHGLAAYKSGSNVIVLTTTSEGDKVLRFVDDGTASPPSTIVASAPAGVSLRGVTLSPTP